MVTNLCSESPLRLLVMNKYILGIDGMKCGMCEIHVEDIVRKNFIYKKVKANHFKNEVVVISPIDISEEDFVKAFYSTGYRITSYFKTIAIKHLFSWR